MNIALLGLGPVGLATAWDLLRRGHRVLGWDQDADVRERLNRGDFARVESLAPELTANLGGRLKVLEDPRDLGEARTMIICVGTPAGANGFDLQPLVGALDTALSFQKLESVHLILRSTLVPGTIQEKVLPLFRKGAFNGRDIELSYYPEFLREKFARDDIENPPLRVAAHCSPRARGWFLEIFPSIDRETADFNSAEMLKLTCNAFHAMKVVFANEIGALCMEADADPWSVMKLFCEDRKLNISEKYLRPGGAFGGPCLDKDLSALEYLLNARGVDGELLKSIQRSNDRHRLQKAGVPEWTPPERKS